MIRRTIIICFVFIFVASCAKLDTPVGVDVLPNSDLLGTCYQNIYAKVSYTQYADTSATSNYTNSNLLGSLNDPVFGRTDASIYANFEAEASPHANSAVLDSTVLVLYYNSSIAFIGDTTDPLSVNVFLLNESITRDSIYYSKRKIGYEAGNSMTYNGQSKLFYPRLNHSFYDNKDAPAPAFPQLRIRLRDELGELLFNNDYCTGTNIQLLQEKFKGLFITTNQSILTQPTYGSIFYLDMNDSRLFLYYHDSTQSTTINYYVGGQSVRYGYFEHDYKYLAQTNLVNQLTVPSDSIINGKKNIYLQGLTGVKAKIEFPDLLNWVDSNIVINKAELQFKIDNSNNDFGNAILYPRPARLFLQGVDPTTDLPTTLYENLYAFGGFYDVTNQLYAFEIPHTLAQIFSQKLTNTTFYLSVFTDEIYPQRVVLHGCGGLARGDSAIRIKLWYTRLNFPKNGKAPHPHPKQEVIVAPALKK